MKTQAINQLLFRAFAQTKKEFDAYASSGQPLGERPLIIKEMKDALNESMRSSDLEFLVHAQVFLLRYNDWKTSSLNIDAINDPILGELIDLLGLSSWEYLENSPDIHQEINQKIKHFKISAALDMIIRVTHIYATLMIRLADNNLVVDKYASYALVEQCVDEFFVRLNGRSIEKLDVFIMEAYRYNSIKQRVALDIQQGKIESARSALNRCFVFINENTGFSTNGLFESECVKLDKTLLSYEAPPAKKKKSRAKSKKTMSINAPLTNELITTPLELAERHQARLDEFKNQFPSFVNRNECYAMIRCIYDSLAACIKTGSLNMWVNEFNKTNDFIVQYSFTHLESFLWIKEHEDPVSLSVSILHDMSAIITDLGWVALSQNEKHFNDSTSENSLASFAIIFSGVIRHVMYQSMLELHVCRTMLNNPALTALNQMTLDIHNRVKKVNDNINQCIVRLADKNIADRFILPEETMYYFEKMKAMGALIRADLELKKGSWASARSWVTEFDVFKSNYARLIDEDKELWLANYDDTINAMADLLVADDEREKQIKGNSGSLKPAPTSLKLLAEEKQSIKKLQKPAAITATAEKAFFEVTRRPYSERLKEIKKNKKAEKINALYFDTSRLPICYHSTNPLSILLKEISNIIETNKFPFDVFMYGSGNIKTNPGDFDILIPGVRTSDQMKKVNELIDVFEVYSGKCKRDNTGKRGYTKDDRYIIPMLWATFKIDFNISQYSHFTKHALTTDFTIGALYFDFKRATVYQLHSIQAWADFDSRTLNTLGDSINCFRNDPSRILRGVRWIVEEGFHFSDECEHAMQCLFSEEQNIFAALPLGKLCHQLKLLFNPCYRDRSIAELSRLGALSLLNNVLVNALSHEVHEDTRIKVQQYYEIIEFYSVGWNFTQPT